MVVCSFQSMYMTVSTCTHTLPYANLQLQGFLYAYAELFEHLLVRDIYTGRNEVTGSSDFSLYIHACNYSIR